MVFRKILTDFVVIIKKREEGFTLIELVFALTIISILTALVIPQFSSLLNQKALEEAAYNLAADIRYIKQKSIANNGVGLPKITVVQAENYYRVYSEPMTVEKTVDLNNIYGGRVSIIGVSSTNSEISFNYLGTPVKSGSITLRSKDGKILYVIISAVMGRIRVSTTPPQSWE